jgi:NADPH-dependent glutamate synthase beta subunit-like oxidoreductase
MAGFKIADAVTFELTKEQYDQLRAMIDQKNPFSKKAAGAKTLSQAFGFGESSTKVAVEEMFSPAVKIYPTLDPSKDLENQTVDLVRLAVYAVTCSCLAQTCTQNTETGCPIFRDVEAMKDVQRSIKVYKDGDKYLMRMQCRTTEANPYSIEKAFQRHTKHVPFEDTGQYCGSGAGCKFGCTWNDPTAKPIEELSDALLKEEKPEGVLQYAFETSLRQLSRAIELENGESLYSSNFKAPEITKLGKVAIFGAGPAGMIQAYDLRKQGYEVHLFDNQEFVGGATNDLIPPDKSDISLSKEHTEQLQKMGIVFHSKTKIGDSLTKWEEEKGIKLVTVDELKKQGFDVISCSFGIYDEHRSRGLGGIEGEKGNNIIPLETMLRQTNEYRIELMAELAKEVESKKPVNEKEFTTQFIEDYYNTKPLIITLQNQQITLKELAEAEIIVSGVGYSGHDAVRTIMQMLSNGNPHALEANIRWQARSLNIDSDKPWPENNPKKEFEPASKMIKHLHELGNNSVSDENLTAINAIKRDGSGNIESIEFERRKCINPNIAAINPSEAKYETEKKYSKEYKNGKVFVITATGYEVKKDHPIFKQLGVEKEGAYPSSNYHAGFIKEESCAVFTGGNLSQDKPGLADEVVNAYQTGLIAAKHISNYLSKIVGLNKNDREAIFQKNQTNIITPEQVFGKSTSSMIFDLTSLILNNIAR